MKISPEHYAHMKNVISPFIGEIDAIRENAKNDPRVKDVEKAVRWNLSYRSGLSAFICDYVYPQGCDDKHVDTALRNIVKELAQ